jgi:nitroimidazol reductase NimA-like FMN-containing flavoprotein (pyridoxamine 5'-phosphate oxidase superfamily)
MNLKMTKQEREAFLADLHVGVISLTRADRGPLTVPIWYDYEPGGYVWFVTERTSAKGKLLGEGAIVTMCAQTEEPPSYKYVTVEGPVVSIEDADLERDIRPIAIRYMGKEMGDMYADSTGDKGQVRVTMRCEKWATMDYGKMGDA